MCEKAEIYDAHVHYLWRHSRLENRDGCLSLREKGLKGLGLIVMGHHPSDPEKCLAFIPHSYHDKIGRHLFFGSEGMALPSPEEFPGLEVFPYLDSRYLTEEESDLSSFAAAGFRGLKLLYVPEEDKVYGMTGWPGLFGKSRRDFERLTIGLIEQARALAWPVIFHVDLRQEEGFVENILADSGDQIFIFPHFGFSRKIMARLLIHYPGCFTDFSSLLPFMKASPQAYRDFILTYQDQVLFGSDATSDWPELICDYIDTVANLIGDAAVLQKIFRDNYLKSHRLS
ncbi:MAG TPA: hypothetical protein ENN66_01805 [Proteobacteria bacterium]|nr:hypothetical protein [Pseudomonadota bacterium]